jgi:P-type Cu2+ transporter
MTSCNTPPHSKPTPSTRWPKGFWKRPEMTVQEPDEFNSITGKGIEGKVDGKNVKVVSPGFVRENNFDYPRDQVEEISSQGKTVVFVIIEDELCGAIALGDEIRDTVPTCHPAAA